MAAPVVPYGIVPEVLQYYNFDDWSIRVKTYLLGKELWEVVEGTETEEEDDKTKSKAWRKNNAKALHVIQFCCGDDAFSCISGVRTAKDAWQALEEEFQTPGIIKIIGTDRDERPVDNDAEPGDEIEIMETETIEGWGDRSNFFHHLKQGNWKAAMDLVRRYPNLIRARIPSTGMTILHMAFPDDHGNRNIVNDHGNRNIVNDHGNVPDDHGNRNIVNDHGNVLQVDELVQLMKAKDLEIRAANGLTAFALAIFKNVDIQIVSKMVEKNKNLLTMRMPPQNRIPVGFACAWSNWKMVKHLLHLTPPEALNSVHGAELISLSFCAQKFDIALELIQRFPNLATVKDNRGGTPLSQLAGMRCAFLSGSQLKFWEKWIYNGIRIEEAPPINNQWCIFPGISRIYQMKLIHNRFKKILDCMSHVTDNMHVDQYLCNSFVQKAMFQAVERGHVEFINLLCKVNPVLWGVHDINKKCMFHFAVECRQEEIYNLIHYMVEGSRKTSFITRLDNFYNSMLHAAGRVSPFAQLDKIQGAALQMQRELQWFKEVEKIVPFHIVESKNFKERKTARELFTENHKELVKAGESSMKDTATSCTVVGALIVTIMFAAAFTVPGGNNENSGAPMFLNKWLFMVFIASDAISLFSSTTSVMIFLGIFTSRYAEDDFLKSLPTKMIVGLLTLFLSVTSMMIAFASALFLMLHEPWIVGPFSFLASVPIVTFVWMQAPLFVATLKSTYGKGIFNNKLKRRN